MKPLENTFKEELEELEEEKALMGKYTYLLVAYHKDPDNAITEVLKTLKPEDKDYDVFCDVQTGLNGDYTRDRAIVLGKKNLIFMIETLKKEMEEELSELKVAIENNIAIIDVNISSILETNKINQLKQELDDVLSDPVNTEYFIIKLKEFMQHKLVDSVDKQITIEQFISNWLEVSEYLGDLSGLDSVMKEAISTYNGNNDMHKIAEDLIKEVKEKNAPVSDVEDHIYMTKPEASKDMDVEEPYLIPTLLSHPDAADSTLDSIQALQVILERIKISIGKLNGSKSTIKSYASKITANKTILLGVDDILKGIKDYEDNGFNLDVLDTIFKVGIISTTNYLQDMNKVYNVLSEAMVQLNNEVNLIDASDEFMRELVNYGTLKKKV